MWFYLPSACQEKNPFNILQSLMRTLFLILFVPPAVFRFFDQCEVSFMNYVFVVFFFQFQIVINISFHMDHVCSCNICNSLLHSVRFAFLSNCLYIYVFIYCYSCRNLWIMVGCLLYITCDTDANDDFCYFRYCHHMWNKIKIHWGGTTINK